MGRDFLQPIGVFGGAPGVNSKGRQNETGALSDLFKLQVRRHVHRGGDGENLFLLDLLERLVEQVAVFVQVNVSVDEHRQLFAAAGFSEVQAFEERDKGWMCATGRKPAAVLPSPAQAQATAGC